MNSMNQGNEPRWRKLEEAKRQTRKVAFALMGIALTSLFVALTTSAA